MADLTAGGVTVGVPKQATLQPATWLSVFPLPVYFEVISVGVFPSVGEGREGKGEELTWSKTFQTGDIWGKQAGERQPLGSDPAPPARHSGSLIGDGSFEI